MKVNGYEIYLYKGYYESRNYNDIKGEFLIRETDCSDGEVYYVGYGKILSVEEDTYIATAFMDIDEVFRSKLENISTDSDEVVETTDNLIATNPAEDVTDETITSTDDTVDVDDDKEAISKTTDGRPVYEGETVYVVKRGDCLWAIAEKLLGSGRKYTELFTRNNDIIEKAELIFPGQEVIVIAK